MAANTNAVFELSGNNTPLAFSTANTARDGSGTIGTLVTPGSNGSVWRGFALRSTIASPAADMVRVFLSHDSGSTWRLMDEITVSATSGSNTAPTYGTYYTPPFGPTLLASTDRIGLSTAVGQAYAATPFSEDL